ncbi:MAG: hypothetical protein WEB93_08035, partial [Sphingomonadales bacterium]
MNHDRPDAARYHACIARVASEPGVARRAASLWLENEGGVPAKHCLALSLIELGRYAQAAQWLEEGARDVGAGRGLDALGVQGGRAIHFDMLMQAGHAWLMARDHDRSVA